MSTITHHASPMDAINLALTGRLSDKPDECISPVIAEWITRIQDAMPDELRNSAEWRELLPNAADTGRELETERLKIIMDWMWGTALPLVQPLADLWGFGGEWYEMCELRTQDAASTATDAAVAASSYAAAYAAARADTWTELDPVGLLRRLIEVGGKANATTSLS